MHETDRKVKLEESSSMYILKLPLDFTEQSGAVEACWAHNPEVRGSKPRSANIFFSLKNSRKLFFLMVAYLKKCKIVISKFPNVVQMTWKNRHDLFIDLVNYC